MTDVKIAPSLLSADFAHLGQAVTELDEAGADYMHLDIMDGHFVPNITFGPPVIKALRPLTKKVFDVHLMIDNPAHYIDAFADAGADIITIHSEADRHCHRTLQAIRDKGLKAGLAFNPATPFHCLDHVIDLVDLVLVMTVNPGFGGQSYIPLEGKIRDVRNRIDTSGRDIDLQVDGGISPDTAARVKKAGATVLVAGTAIMQKGPDHYKQAIEALREA